MDTQQEPVPKPVTSQWPPRQERPQQQYAPEQPPKKPRSHKLLIRALLFSIVLLLIAGAYFWQQREIADVRTQNVELKSKVASLEQQLKEEKKISADLASPGSSLQTLEKKANTTEAHSSAAYAVKMAEFYSMVKGYYPSSTDLELYPEPGSVDFKSYPQSSLMAMDIALVMKSTDLSAENGKNTVAYIPCGVAPRYTGYRVYYYDFMATKQPTAPQYTDGSGC